MIYDMHAFSRVSHRCRNRAFSLVELIVAIAIIVVIIAIFLPTAILARRHAETSRCASNLRQIGFAFQDYAAANGGWLPEWSGWHTWPRGAAEDSSGAAWTEELIPYLGVKPDSEVYNCPSFRGLMKCRNYFLAAQWTGRCSGKKRAMKTSDVTMTSRFVLSGDKTQRGLYPPPYGTSDHETDDADPDDYGDELPVLAWPWEQGGFYMHQGGSNVLFDDLHVSLVSRFDGHTMTFNPHRMENWRDVSGD